MVEQDLLAEFAGFLLIAEAPLNSANVELILVEARRPCPGKQVRCFSFGQYHPQYLVGIRPFIDRGATILCCKTDEEYVKYLASTSHSLAPEARQTKTQQPKSEFVGSEKAISDETNDLRIIFVGEKPAHTRDHLFYYIPKQKMLSEGDLPWMEVIG